MSQTVPAHVVIVGAGHGGANVAAMLRQSGYDGRVTLIGDEADCPYQRPPLSKDYLRGAMDDEQLLIKPRDFYADQGIDARWGSRVTCLDTRARTVSLEDGETIAFDALVLATGAGPRPLTVDGADLDGVHYLRTHGDAQALGASAVPGARLAIIGGGYVGLEVAASAYKLGAGSVVLEREQRALARVASQELADFLTDHHAEREVDVVVGADVVGIEEGEGGRVGAVRLADGRRHECDAVLVGIGAIPRTELGQGAGLDTDGGIVVDEHGRTSAPGVYAVGDVTARPVPGHSGRHRLESIPSAVEQAKQVVAHLLGKPPAAPEVPWFWSDQYDLKIKIAGLVRAGDQAVVRGEPASGRFSVFHLSGDVVVAAETVSSAPDFMLAKKLIASAASVSADKLADVQVPLRDLL